MQVLDGYGQVGCVGVRVKQIACPGHRGTVGVTLCFYNFENDTWCFKRKNSKETYWRTLKPL